MKSSSSTGMIILYGLIALDSAVGAAHHARDEITELIQIFSTSDWDHVSRARFALEVRQDKAIQHLIDLMRRDERVKLENTADLIYPGAETFYGHGGILNYDIDWLSVRAGWALEALTFEDFGFSEPGIDEDGLLRATKAGKTDVPLREVVPFSTDAAMREKQRLQAIQRTKQWWVKNRTNWTRLASLIAALESENPNRVLSAIHWLRFEESPIDGFSRDVYITRVLPIVKRLAQSSEKRVADQAGHLVRAYDENYWGWLETKNEVAFVPSYSPLNSTPSDRARRNSRIH